MTTPISIIIPAFNQVDYCRQCIESIHAHTRRAYKLILVDNGSADGVPAYFDSIPDAEVVHLPENLGFAGGVNAGLARAEGHVLLLNNDTLVPEGWLGRMEAALLESEDVGIVGPTSNNVSGSQLIPDLEFSTMDEINAFAAKRAQEQAGQRRDESRLVGFCMLIRDRVVQKVGGLDESFGLGNFEDDDYCLRTRDAGYRLMVAEDAFVFHYGERTFVGMGIVADAWDDLMESNAQRFLDKWAESPEWRAEAMRRSKELNRRATEAWKAGDTHQALKLFKDALEIAPQYERNHNDFGVVLCQAGEVERALDYFRRALRLAPDYAEARENFLKAAGALGKEEVAKTWLHELDAGEKA
jgi:GT2 family glycosyltransferase